MKHDKGFNCSTDNLYAVLLLAWSHCQDNVSAFAAAYPFYTKKYINDAIAAVTKAQNQQNNDQRNANSSTERQALINAADQCLVNWQLLKTYIMNGYDEPVTDINLKNAGAAYYIKAAKYNWSAMRVLLKMAGDFLANNGADLVERQIMSADFADKFASDAADFSQKNTDFQNAVVAKRKARKDKTSNDSEIYTLGIGMMRDGQRIFVNTPQVQEQFIFARLLAIVKGNKQGKLSGYVYDANQLPVAGAVITSKDQQYTATTNLKGRYSIGRIAAGDYTFSVTCPGYAPVEQSITLSAGTASRLSFTIQNIMKKVA